MSYVLRKKRYRRVFATLFIGSLSFYIFYLLLIKVNQSRSDNTTDNSEDELLSEEDPEHIPVIPDPNRLQIELLSTAVAEVQNLPNPEFLLRHHIKSKCATFPQLYNIEFSNLYWQVQKISNLTFFLYKAYYDNRLRSNVGPLIRILSMVNHNSPTELSVPMTCQFWFPDQDAPIISPVTAQRSIWYKKWSMKGLYIAYIITCPVPSNQIDTVPISISLVENKCDNATNNLRLINSVDNLAFEDQDKNKYRFGVCVKGLDLIHDDKSTRLIEWIELLSILGADKIFFYEFSVHPNVKKVLDYYVKSGIVELTPLSFPGYLPNEPNLRHLFLSHASRLSDKRKNEVIPYNDCLYRNLNRFDYVTMLDTDEVIVPKDGGNWNDLIKLMNSNVEGINLTEGEQPSTYCFRNIYFFDSLPSEDARRMENDYKIPNNFHMLQHIYRSMNYTPPKKFLKCFHATERTALVHNHYPLGCLGGKCVIIHAGTEMAHLQHYRSTCVKDLANCEDYETSPVIDRTIWKYKDELIRRVSVAMTNLGLM